MQTIKIKKWKSSRCFEHFLRSLNIDPSQAVSDSVCVQQLIYFLYQVRDDVPIFACGLGSPLEPVKSCDNPVVLPPTVLTPTVSTSTVEPNQKLTADVQQPLDPAVSWNNVQSVVNWGPQAEVSTPSNDVPECPVSDVLTLQSSLTIKRPDMIVIPASSVGIESGSVTSNNGYKEWNRHVQSISSESCKEQQHDGTEEEICRGFDRVLTDEQCIKNRDLIYNNRCRKYNHCWT